MREKKRVGSKHLGQWVQRSTSHRREHAPGAVLANELENGPSHRPPPAPDQPVLPLAGAWRQSLLACASPVAASLSSPPSRQIRALADRCQGSSAKAEAGRRGGSSSPWLSSGSQAGPRIGVQRASLMEWPTPLPSCSQGRMGEEVMAVQVLGGDLGKGGCRVVGLDASGRAEIYSGRVSSTRSRRLPQVIQARTQPPLADGTSPTLASAARLVPGAHPRREIVGNSRLRNDPRQRALAGLRGALASLWSQLQFLFLPVLSALVLLRASSHLHSRRDATSFKQLAGLPPSRVQCGVIAEAGLIRA